MHDFLQLVDKIGPTRGGVHIILHKIVEWKRIEVSRSEEIVSTRPSRFSDWEWHGSSGILPVAIESRRCYGCLASSVPPPLKYIFQSGPTFISGKKNPWMGAWALLFLTHIVRHRQDGTKMLGTASAEIFRLCPFPSGSSWCSLATQKTVRKSGI